MRLKPIHLVPSALLAIGLLSPAFGADQSKQEADDAQIEAKLEAARERLEAAAREVAELSGQLGGSMMRHFEVMRRGEGGLHATIGVVIGGRDGDEDRSSKAGVRIDSVTPGGPASDAGLKAGDLLVSIDGKDLRKPENDSGAGTLVRHVRSVKPGDKVKLEYVRDGKTQKVEVVTEGARIDRFARYFPHDRIFTAPVVGVAPHPPMPPSPGMPFTRGFRGFGGHGMLDMELITLTPKLGHYFGTEKGVLVVRPPSESELALEEGDVIVDIGGRAPQSGGHALRILRSYQQGEKVNVNVLRNRKNVKLQFTVPKREGFGGEAGAFWLESLPDGEFHEGIEALPAPEEPT